MHLALICPELHGHLNPMTTLGAELKLRGHRVSLVSSPEAKPKAETCGFELLAVGVPEFESGYAAAARARLGEMTGFAALRYTGKLLTEIAALTIRDVPPLLKRHGVQAALVDQVSPAGSAVADVLGLPFVVVCNAMAMHQETGVPPGVTPWPYRPTPLGRLRNRLGNTLLKIAARPLNRVVSDYRVANGLGPYTFGNPHGYGLAQIAQQPAFFDFPRSQLPSHFHYTAPWHAAGRDADTPFPWDKLDGRPLIYASLGTLQNRMGYLFDAILEACSTLDAQLVLSLGRPDATWDKPIPKNAIVVPFAPQLKLLERASALVTHAGLNTALEGIARGLPMLCLPITNDQPGVARRVEWLGAGEMLSPRRATAARIRAAMSRLLGNPKYRAAAVRCRDKLAAAGSGVARAADIVERTFAA